MWSWRFDEENDFKIEKNENEKIYYNIFSEKICYAYNGNVLERFDFTCVCIVEECEKNGNGWCGIKYIQSVANGNNINDVID